MQVGNETLQLLRGCLSHFGDKVKLHDLVADTHCALYRAGRHHLEWQRWNWNFMEFPCQYDLWQDGFQNAINMSFKGAHLSHPKPWNQESSITETKHFPSSLQKQLFSNTLTLHNGTLHSIAYSRIARAMSPSWTCLDWNETSHSRRLFTGRSLPCRHRDAPKGQIALENVKHIAEGGPSIIFFKLLCKEQIKVSVVSRLSSLFHWHEPRTWQVFFNVWSPSTRQRSTSCDSPKKCPSQRS